MADIQGTHHVLVHTLAKPPGECPIFLLALSPSKHRKHHPNHALSPVVFRKVQFLGPYFLSSTPGLLKLWVATHKWVAEPSHVGRENGSCKNIIMVITSVSLPTNISWPLFY